VTPEPPLSVERKAIIKLLTKIEELKIENKLLKNEIAETFNRQITDYFLKCFSNAKKMKSITSESFVLCGVYCLFSKGNLVYIGQSINIFARIQNHTDKTFDTVRFYPCEAKHLNEQESFLIGLFKPKYNISGTGSTLINKENIGEVLVGLSYAPDDL